MNKTLLRKQSQYWEKWELMKLKSFRETKETQSNEDIAYKIKSNFCHRISIWNIQRTQGTKDQENNSINECTIVLLKTRNANG